MTITLRPWVAFVLAAIFIASAAAILPGCGSLRGDHEVGLWQHPGKWAY